MRIRVQVRRVGGAGVLLGCALMLTACGIPMQNEPQPLPSGAVPQSIASPAP